MPDLPQGVIDLLGALYRSLLRDENDRVEPGSDSRTAVLSVLRRTGGCSMSELAGVLRVTKPNVTFLVDRLEGQGLLARTPDPEDRRKTTIDLTEKGKREVEGRRAVVLSRVQERLALLSAKERAWLEGTLPKVMALLSKLDNEGD